MTASYSYISKPIIFSGLSLFHFLLSYCPFTQIHFHKLWYIFLYINLLLMNTDIYLYLYIHSSSSSPSDLQILYLFVFFILKTNLRCYEYLTVPITSYQISIQCVDAHVVLVIMRFINTNTCQIGLR